MNTVEANGMNVMTSAFVEAMKQQPTGVVVDLCGKVVPPVIDDFTREEIPFLCEEDHLLEEDDYDGCPNWDDIEAFSPGEYFPLT